MYLYTELWKFRPAWRELAPDARKQWMDTLLGGLQQQLESGVEVVGFVANDNDTAHSSGYDFMAVWKMPDKETAVGFEAFVEASGLHTYYEQVNTRGAAMELGAVVEALLNP
jgi:hypothetical protein